MKRYSILVVDDQPEVRVALRRALGTASSTIYEASDAHEALDVVKNTELDMVLSDYEMPGMDGLELLQRIRLTQPSVRRVLLTGRADVKVAVRALNEGAVNRFLLKPWDYYELKGIVELTLHG